PLTVVCDPPGAEAWRIVPDQTLSLQRGGNGIRNVGRDTHAGLQNLRRAADFAGPPCPETSHAFDDCRDATRVWVLLLVGAKDRKCPNVRWFQLTDGRRNKLGVIDGSGVVGSLSYHAGKKLDLSIVS